MRGALESGERCSRSVQRCQRSLWYVVILTNRSAGDRHCAGRHREDGPVHFLSFVIWIQVSQAKFLAPTKSLEATHLPRYLKPERQKTCMRGERRRHESNYARLVGFA